MGRRISRIAFLCVMLKNTLSTCRTFERCYDESVAAVIEWSSTVANEVGDIIVVKFWCEMKNFQLVEASVEIFALSKLRT